MCTFFFFSLSLFLYLPVVLSIRTLDSESITSGMHSSSTGTCKKRYFGRFIVTVGPSYSMQANDQLCVLKNCNCKNKANNLLMVALHDMNINLSVGLLKK